MEKKIFITIDRSFDETNFESEIELIFVTAYLNQSHLAKNERVGRFSFFFFCIFEETCAYLFSSVTIWLQKLNNIWIQSIVIIASSGWKLCQPESLCCFFFIFNSLNDLRWFSRWPFSFLYFHLSYRLGLSSN